MRALILVALLASTAAAKDLAALEEAAPTCDAGRAYCFPIKLHVVDSGSGIIARPQWFATQLAAANRHFAPLGVSFQLAELERLPASATHLTSREDRNAVATGKLVGPVIHVFIVGQLDDVDIAGAVIYGVAWRLPKDKRKFLIVSTQAHEHVLAHELGHFFGLPHSTHAISIMNKTPRDEPPYEQRTFADVEIAAMRPHLQRLVRTRVVVAVEPKGAAKRDAKVAPKGGPKAGTQSTPRPATAP